MKGKIRPPKNFNELETLYHDNPYSEELKDFKSLWNAIGPEILSSRESKKKPFHYQPSGLLWSFAGITALICIICAALWINSNLSFDSGRAILVSHVTGEAEYKYLKDKVWHPLSVGSQIRTGGQIRTKASSYCDIQTAGKGIIRLQAASGMKINKLYNPRVGAADIQLTLDYGEAAVKPSHLNSNENFELAAPQLTARVTGTKFNVISDPAGFSQVSVLEGRVIVEPLLSRRKLNTSIALTPLDFIQLSAQDIGIIEDKLSPVSSPSSPENINEYIKNKITKISAQEWKTRNPLDDSMIIRKHAGITPVRLESEPSGARLYAGKEYFGRTPFTINLKELKDTNISVEKEGYISTNVFLKPSSVINIKLIADLGTPILWDKSCELPDNENNAAHSDSLLVLTSGKYLLIFDRSGNLINKASVLDSGRLTKPVIAGKRIFIGSDAGGIFVYSLGGKLIAKDLSAGMLQFGSSPAVNGSNIVIPSIDKGIQIFTIAGTKLSYQSEIAAIKEKAIYSTPLFISNGNILVFATEDGTISAYNLLKGEIIYNKIFTKGRVIEPLAGDEHIALVLYHDQGLLYAFNPSTGQEIWQYRNEIIHKSARSLFLTPEQLFVIGSSSSESSILSISTATGIERYHKIFNQPIQSFSISGSIVYYTFSDNTINAWNIEEQKLLWSYRAANKPGILSAAPDGVYAISTNELLKLKIH